MTGPFMHPNAVWGPAYVHKLGLSSFSLYKDVFVLLETKPKHLELLKHTAYIHSIVCQENLWLVPVKSSGYPTLPQQNQENVGTTISNCIMDT